MEFSEVIQKRRSTRAFTKRRVTEAELNTMLTAATRAPSACNMQSWHFFAITDESVKKSFKEKGICAQWACDAPLLIVVCTDGEAITARFGEIASKLFVFQDTAAAIENILLCAVDLGLNGCWIGAFDVEGCRRELNIDEKYGIVAMLAIGEAEIEIPPRERKPLSEVVTYIDKAEGKPEKREEEPFHLCQAALPDSVFDELNLAHSTFSNINFNGTRFANSNMTSTFYSDLMMRGSHFDCVNLEEAAFENPNLRAAQFKGGSLAGAAFEDCDMSGVTVDGINLKKALKFYRKHKK